MARQRLSQYLQEKGAKDIFAVETLVLFERMGLREHLTPQQWNGFRSMVERIIRADAQAQRVGWLRGASRAREKRERAGTRPKPQPMLLRSPCWRSLPPSSDPRPIAQKEQLGSDSPAPLGSASRVKTHKEEGTRPL